MHADRANRAALILLGVLALAAGAGGMLTSTGVLGSAYARNTLFGNRVSDWAGQHYWAWYIAAAVCAVIVLIALRWIIALLTSTDRAGDIPVPVASREGTTLLRPAALTGALTREISTYRGVESVHGRVIGEPRDPEIVLSVTATQAASLRELHQRIETEALAHARQALSKTDLAIQLDLAVSRKTP